jgi:hypothetical protein
VKVRRNSRTAKSAYPELRQICPLRGVSQRVAMRRIPAHWCHLRDSFCRIGDRFWRAFGRFWRVNSRFCHRPNDESTGALPPAAPTDRNCPNPSSCVLQHSSIFIVLNWYSRVMLSEAKHLAPRAITASVRTRAFSAVGQDSSAPMNRCLRMTFGGVRDHSACATARRLDFLSIHRDDVLTRLAAHPCYRLMGLRNTVANRFRFLYYEAGCPGPRVRAKGTVKISGAWP